MELKEIKIKSIKKLQEKRHVYDLSVKGNNNFFIGTTNTLTHNCDAITPDGQRALRNLMEAHSSTTRFILTANYIERIIDPLVSRTQTYKLVPPSKKEVAIRLVEILNNENVFYETKTIAQIVNTTYPDIRKAINTIQMQTKNGKLEVDIASLINQDIKIKIIDTIGTNTALDEKINLIRKIVADSHVQDFTELYRVLFDYIDDISPTKVPQSIIAIAEGMYRDGQVPDKEINFIATLYNILTN
jgi:DNA polymerase III delta prime subunit